MLTIFCKIGQNGKEEIMKSLLDRFKKKRKAVPIWANGYLFFYFTFLLTEAHYKIHLFRYNLVLFKV